MQGNRGQVEAQQRHVLDDECVHADAVQVVNEALHLHQLVVIDEGIDCRIDACPKLVGVIAGAAHVVERVGRVGTGTVVGSAHIHGIGAMVDSGDGDVGVAGGR